APANFPTVAIPRLAAPPIPLNVPCTFLTPPSTFESSNMTSIFTFPSAIYILHPQYKFALILGAQRLSYFDLFNVLHLEHLISYSPVTFPSNLLHSLHLTSLNFFI